MAAPVGHPPVPGSVPGDAVRFRVEEVDGFIFGTTKIAACESLGINPSNGKQRYLLSVDFANGQVEDASMRFYVEAYRLEEALQWVHAYGTAHNVNERRDFDAFRDNQLADGHRFFGYQHRGQDGLPVITLLQQEHAVLLRARTSLGVGPAVQSVAPDVSFAENLIQQIRRTSREMQDQFKQLAEEARAAERAAARRAEDEHDDAEELLLENRVPEEPFVDPDRPDSPFLRPHPDRGDGVGSPVFHPHHHGPQLYDPASGRDLPRVNDNDGFLPQDYGQGFPDDEQD